MGSSHTKTNIFPGDWNSRSKAPISVHAWRFFPNVLSKSKEAGKEGSQGKREKCKKVSLYYTFIPALSRLERRQQHDHLRSLTPYIFLETPFCNFHGRLSPPSRTQSTPPMPLLILLLFPVSASNDDAAAACPRTFSCNKICKTRQKKKCPTTTTGLALPILFFALLLVVATAQPTGLASLYHRPKQGG
jgi:hypothetical protein